MVSLLVCGVIHGCVDGSPTDVSVPLEVGPQYDDVYGSGDCPPDTTNCVAMTSAEKDAFRNELMDHLDTAGACGTIYGELMTALDGYHDWYKFHDPRTSGKRRGGYNSGSGDYSVNMDYFNNGHISQPGWTSKTAAQTGIHEGYHGVWGLQGGESAAYAAEGENQCFNS